MKIAKETALRAAAAVRKAFYAPVEGTAVAGTFLDMALAAIEAAVEPGVECPLGQDCDVAGHWGMVRMELESGATPQAPSPPPLICTHCGCTDFMVLLDHPPTKECVQCGRRYPA